ncbi:MAG: hypothetical protein KC912_15510 [Proteobacteria bacterium]|nr:hypothetical protein [Pseudomonadota bacterium]
MKPRAISLKMKGVFAGSALIMFAHKVECWWMHEWLDSPFFQWMYDSGGILATTPEDAFGETVFLAFISWLFAGLFMGYLVMRGGWGPIVALGVWGLTFILEWHHVIRTVVSGEYYVGAGTSVVYLAFMAYYWWVLLTHIDWERTDGLAAG